MGIASILQNHLTASARTLRGLFHNFARRGNRVVSPPRPIIEDPDSVQRIRVIYHPDKNENKGGIIALYD